jgi:hypothetical protein
MAVERVNGVEHETTGIDNRDTPVTFDTSGEIDESPDESGIPIIEPSSIIIEAEPADTRKRRGRPRGSTSTSGKQSTKEVSQDLTSILLSVHFMLAKLTSISELELDEDEAAKLGSAVARVNKEFGVQIMSPKTAALVNLGMVGMGVYGPRVVAVMNNAKKKKEPRPMTSAVM